MDVFKLRIFCLPGTMVLCNGFRIMHWRETWYSRLLCPMWLQDVDWKGHLQVFIGGAVGRYWVTSGKLCLSRTKASGSLAGLLVVRFLEKTVWTCPSSCTFPARTFLRRQGSFDEQVYTKAFSVDSGFISAVVLKRSDQKLIRRGHEIPGHSSSLKGVKARNLKADRLAISYSITSNQGTHFVAKEPSGTIQNAACQLAYMLVYTQLAFLSCLGPPA